MTRVKLRRLTLQPICCSTAIICIAPNAPVMAYKSSRRLTVSLSIYKKKHAARYGVPFLLNVRERER